MTTQSLPASLRSTLPGSCYTDPDIFAREQSTIFEALWCCAVRATDLPRPGSFTTVQVGHESVLLVRTARGDINAFLNVCRHRGARLCATGGEVRRSLRCPYHAWTYDLDGALIAAPNLATMPDVDRADYGLVSVHTRQWLGYVWVCVADSPPDFETDVVATVADRLGDRSAIDRYTMDSLAVGRSITYDVAANWKLLVENFMECYHCPTIHPELVRVLPEFAQGWAAQSYVGHGAQFGDQIDGFTVDGSPGQDRIPTLHPEQDRRYYAATVRPNLFLNLVPDHVIVMRMSPLAVDRTIVECDWLFLPDVVERGSDLSSSVELFDRVNRQDFALCEQCQPAMSSRAYAQGGVLVRNEHHLTDFHDWVRTKLAGAGTEAGAGAAAAAGAGG